jgi:type IV secretory pathway TrbD component
VCLPVGHFSYAGHTGFNRVRFDNRLGRQELGPGTYKISARTRTGRTLPRVTVVVVESDAPTAGELAVARAANVCAAAGAAAASSSGSAANAANVERALQPKSEPLAGGIPGKGANAHSGVLAASLEKTVEALRPIVVVLLALAIILLGVASLPRTAVADPRLHDLLARHRVDLAGVGAAALVAVALLFLLG